jgi:cyclopropane-fatty-acyl-phospholipid synthase
MASQKDMDYTYSLIDKIFRWSFGEMKDFSGAMYNGDFNMSLEEAQRQKHEFIAGSLNIKENSRVLDMGCGWGPFLKFIKDRGAKGIGVTLSSGQEKACKKRGLDVHLVDCRTIKPETFGTFDAVVSLGAFEHFCSKQKWKEGKQDEVYSNFFKVVSDLLPLGGRFYLQTMVFGKNVIPEEEMDINADKYSDAYICAALQREFPGSWLPYGEEQITENAKPFFKLISKSSGRLDYIETLKQWQKNFRGFNLKKYLCYSTLLPKYLTNKEFRQRITLNTVPFHRLSFKREILDHFRLVYEKI